MRDVSDRFLEAVRGGHRMKAEARIVTGHQTGVDPVGITIPINSGDVICDATARIRATLDLTTSPDWSVPAAEQAIWPTTPADLLAPYGNEIWVRRGIEFGDRSTEWVSLGYYRIDATSQPNAPLGDLRITASDRMTGIIDAQLLRPRQFPSGTTFEQAVEDLVLEVYPTGEIEYDFDPTTYSVGRRTLVEQDRFAYLADLAASRGRAMYYDHRGVLQFRRPPDPGEPVFDVNSGAHGVLVAASRELSREGIYNAVVATGEGTDDQIPVRGVALDQSVKSATRWGGPFGQVPHFYTSPLITTAGQAREAAEKLLRDVIGRSFSLDFRAVPNPALEPYDPVKVAMPDASYTHVIQSITIPLTPDQPIAAVTKDQTELQIGVE